MELALNPYVPGSGRAPRELFGRDNEIEIFDRVVAASKMRQIDRGMVFSGLRGVGKTVLLNYLREHADRHGWMCVALEAQPGPAGSVANRTRLGRDLHAAARRFPSTSGLFSKVEPVIRSFTLSASSVVGSSASFSMERAASGVLETDLMELVEDLTRELQSERSALAFFIDEMQDVDVELLAALLAAQHLASQRQWPFFIFAAGLPTLPGVLTKSRSYSERLLRYHKVGPLSRRAARSAFVDPARERGVAYADDAVEALLEASQGYPYFVQEFGSATWEVASRSPISLDDALEAIERGWAHLADGFFPARWDRASNKERTYMRAMAEDEDEWSSTSVVAERLQSTLAGLSPTRQRLIEKGIVYAPESGRIAFTVPGMATYIKRLG